MHHPAQLRLFDEGSLLQPLVASEVFPKPPEQTPMPPQRLLQQPNLWLGEFLVSQLFLHPISQGDYHFLYS